MVIKKYNFFKYLQRSNDLIFFLILSVGLTGSQNPQPNPIPSMPRPSTTNGLEPAYVAVEPAPNRMVLRMALRYNVIFYLLF